MRAPRVVAVALLVGLIGACGSRSDLGGQAGAAPRPLITDARTGQVGIPARCVEDWQTLYESPASLTPAIAVAPPELLFGEVGRELDATELRALNLQSRELRTVSDTAAYSDLWVDGDELLIWSLDRLYRMPLAGGPGRVAIDARPAGNGLVEPDAFYWTRADDGGARTGLWRQPRGAADPERIAWIEGRAAAAAQLGVALDRVVVAWGNRALAVALAGGASTPLAGVSDGDLVGVDGRGAYYSRATNVTRRGGEALQFEILRAPADGSAATRFWSRPAGHRLDAVWAMENGWLATGEYYGDGGPLPVVVYIDAEGGEHALACGREPGHVAGRPVLSNGSMYLVFKPEAEQPAIVEIELPTGSPI